MLRAIRKWSGFSGWRADDMAEAVDDGLLIEDVIGIDEIVEDVRDRLWSEQSLWT